MNLDEINIGVSVKYHIGYLPRDRAANKLLDALAKELLNRSTATFSEYQPNLKPKRCTGEFELYQQPIMGKWEYWARRVK